MMTFRRNVVFVVESDSDFVKPIRTDTDSRRGKQFFYVNHLLLREIKNNRMEEWNIWNIISTFYKKKIQKGGDGFPFWNRDFSFHMFHSSIPTARF